LDKLSQKLKAKDEEFEKFRNATVAQIEEITKQFKIQINDKVRYIDEINADIAQKLLLVAKLEKDIAELKTIITTKDEEIKHLLEKTTGNGQTLCFKKNILFRYNVLKFNKNIRARARIHVCVYVRISDSLFEFINYTLIFIVTIILIF
jgi:hypothetical protein